MEVLGDKVRRRGRVDDRSEDLLLGQFVLLADVGNNCRRDEEARNVGKPFALRPSSLSASAIPVRLG